MTTLATVGYGDFTGVPWFLPCHLCWTASCCKPTNTLSFSARHALSHSLCSAAQNIAETIWATFFMFLSVALSAFIIGSFTLIVIRQASALRLILRSII